MASFSVHPCPRRFASSWILTKRPRVLCRHRRPPRPWKLEARRMASPRLYLMKPASFLALSCLAIVAHGSRVAPPSGYVTDKMFLEEKAMELHRRVSISNVTDNTQRGDDTKYNCRGCIKNPDGTPRTVRVMYMEEASSVRNPSARTQAEEMGVPYDCNDPNTRLTKCFDKYEDWHEGWVGEFAYNVLNELALDVKVMTKANFSKDAYEVYKGASSYTRCVWEVRLGNVDLCVGNFWETEERRALAGFASAMDSDILRLGTLSLGQDNTFTPDDFLSIFAPFDRTVWALNAAMIIIASFLIWLVETKSHANLDYYSEDSLHSNMRLSTAEAMGKGLWLGLMAYVSGGAAHVGTTWPAKFIILGFGWFIYISVSSYTANLASFMISKSTTNQLIDSYMQIAKEGGSLCILEAIASMFTTPGINFVKYDDYIPAIEGLYDGRCLGVAVGRNEWRTMVEGGQGQMTVCMDEHDQKRNSFCDCSENPDGCKTKPSGLIRNVQLSGCTCKDDSLTAKQCPEECPDAQKYCSIAEVMDPSFSYYMIFALPVNHELIDYVSAWTIKFRQDGMLLKLRQKYVDDVSPSVCNDGGSEDFENAALDLKSMAGTFVISGTLMIIGMTIFAVEEIKRRLGLGAKAKEAESDEGDEIGEEGDDVTGQHSGTHKAGHRMSHTGEQGITTLGDRTARQLRSKEYEELSAKISKQQRALGRQDKQLDKILGILGELQSHLPKKEVEEDKWHLQLLTRTGTLLSGSPSAAKKMEAESDVKQKRASDSSQVGPSSNPLEGLFAHIHREVSSLGSQGAPNTPDGPRNGNGTGEKNV